MPKYRVTKHQEVAASQEETAPLGIRDEPGYLGAFTRNQSPHALFSNGTRVEKASCEDGDAHGVGVGATVLGSIHNEMMLPGFPPKTVCYFVEWDDGPRTACAVIESKLRKAQTA